ncbi:MAG: hypothetical protein Q9208_005534 [Pyrenodesmia sp. 3 TL-2023]
MFTGIVECIGTITSLTPSPTGTTLTLAPPPFLLSDAHLGDSISINGTCLTITSFTPSSPTASFTVGVSPETLRRTNLGRLRPDDKVNLERAVEASGGRMGGHFVQGHVDTVATVVGVREDGEARVVRLRPRPIEGGGEGGGGGGGIMNWVVEKGYVTLDGASLTVTAVSDGSSGRDDRRSKHEGESGIEKEDEDKEDWFEVMLIAYTQEKIVTASKGVGEEVNVEVDMVGKYVEKSVRGYLEGLAGEGGGGGGGMLEKMVERVVEEKLRSR